ncbi:MAG: sigma-54 dependent transcriptional regulator [Sedimentisphaerales bacterium]|jgi:two-component system response regulator HydG
MIKDAVVLVVDDERDHADGMAEALQKCCAKAIPVYTGRDALEIIRAQDIDVVVTDLKLGGDIDGLEILQEAKKLGQTEVILITAYATIDTCKDAIRHGAYDYLVKPINIDQLRSLVEQAARQVVRMKRTNAQGRAADEDFRFDGVRGNSSQTTGIFEVLRRVAPTNISVLIQGESGTGKELLARAIHDNSNRWNKRFVPINCAGFTETLLESELFGHVKGSFTGAAGDRKGLFEIADKGTLFLDEIGDMPLNMQAKLLRVIEDGVVIPVGGNKPVIVDVRIISATNHDLTNLVEEKKFRQDLYFRIKGVSVSVPPLRQRREDILLLADFFLKEAVGETGSKVAGFTDAAANILASYEWPGNIRQLRNVIRTMVVMSDRDKLDVQDLPPEINRVRQLTGSSNSQAKSASEMPLNEIERQAIIDMLAKTGNNREKAAKLLGIGERTLYRKIKEYNL